MNKYTCPCCGYITLDEMGEYYICPLCRWEDDPSQSESPNLRGGANKPCLIEAQENFILYGICDTSLDESPGDKSYFKQDLMWRRIKTKKTRS